MRRGFTRGFFSGASLLTMTAALGLASPVAAQTATPAPPPPGTIPGTTREEVTPPAPAPALNQPRIHVDSQDAVAKTPCTLDSSDLRVTINSVNFRSASGVELSPGIMHVLSGFAPLQPGDQPIRNVCEMRDRANRLLRSSGYIASVQVLPQDLSGGVLQLMVVTAHITEVRVHGDPGPYRGLLDERIAALQALDPLNEFDAERILLLTSDVPGIDVRLSLRSAGTTPGAVIGDLTIDTVPWRVLANVQNMGSEQIGPGTAYVRAEFYGLTHHEDVTYIGLSDTFDSEEQKIFQIGHTMGLFHNGTTLGASFIYARSRPDIGIDLRTTSTIFNVELYHPIIRSVRRDFAVAAGFDVIEQRTKIYNDTQPLNLDKLSVAYLRAQGQVRRSGFDGGGLSLRGDIEVRQGLDWFGASKRGIVTAQGYSPSRFDGNPKATVVRLNADGVWTVGPVFSLAGALRSQWARDPLLSYEEFSVGNLNIGRGYDPGATTADSAVGWRLEARAKLPPMVPVRPEAFTFYDSVHIWNRDLGTTENDRELRSWGLGLRFYLPKMVAEIYYAKPMDKALSIDAKKADDRFMFTLTMQFLPHGE